MMLNQVKNSLVISSQQVDNHWYYPNENGNLATGSQVIRGQKLYFAEDGLQAKGIFVTDAEGNRHFYDPDSGDLATNKFIADGDDWYYFDENGVQTKGSFAANANGNEHYYDAKSGDRVDDSELTIAAKSEA